jgi:uncharacterized protein
MNRQSAFSYTCNRCGLCCHDKVITLSPYDVIRIARAAGVSTGEAVARFTLRRGSLLKFTREGGCVALFGVQCAVHPGRPLACRLYPLGLERMDGGERFIQLEPAAGSAGIYGANVTVEGFLATNGAHQYLEMNLSYRALIAVMKARVAALADFDVIEPREFGRRAVREAVAEFNFDPNPLIDALFDPNALGCCRENDAEAVKAHLVALEALIRMESDPARIAAAAVMLAVSLGYSPAEAIWMG